MKNLFTFLFLFLFSWASSQMCGTDEALILQNRNESRCDIPERMEFSIKYIVPRTTDGETSIQNSEILENFEILRNSLSSSVIDFNLKDILYIDDSELYEYGVYNMSVISHCYLDDRAINVILWDQEAVGAFSFPPGGIFGSRILISLPREILGLGYTLNTGVIAHEIGHTFSLLHTHHKTEYFHSSNCSFWPDEPPGCYEKANEISSECGDQVSDTPADPCLGGQVSDDCETWLLQSEYLDCNGDLYVPDLKNMMSYTLLKCMREFSDEQISVMENYAACDPYLTLTRTDLGGVIGHQFIFIDEDTEWLNLDQSLNSSVIVTAHLTIKDSYLAISPNKLFAVSGKGKITIDNSELTSESWIDGCEDQWNGINAFNCEGNCIEVVNNSVISRARSAIHLVQGAPASNLQDDEFIVKIDNSTFSSNYSSVRCEFYANSMAEYLDDDFRILDCNSSLFEISNDGTGNAYYPFLANPRYITLVNNPKSNIRHCSFVNSTDQSVEVAFGIHGLNSNLTCDMNSFSDLEIGVNAIGTTILNSPIIRWNMVNSCGTGVSLLGITDAVIYDNNFNLNARALWARNSTNYTISENYTRGQGVNSESLGGFVIQDSGPDNNIIYRNEFFNCVTGILCLGENAEASGSNGLLIACNKFYEPMRRDYTVSQGRIREEQGDVLLSAGNQFSRDETSSGYLSINLTNSEEAKYYFTQSNFFFEPNPVATGVSKILIDDNKGNQCEPIPILSDEDDLQNDDTKVISEYVRIYSEYSGGSVELRNYEDLLRINGIWSEDLRALRNTNNTQSPSDQLIASNYFDLMDVEQSVGLEGLSLEFWNSLDNPYSLTHSEYDSLEYLTKSSNNYIAGLANSILVEFFGFQRNSLLEERSMSFNSFEQTDREIGRVVVFPNAIVSRLNIKLSLDFFANNEYWSQAEIIDLSGRSLHSFVIVEEIYQTDLSQLSKGIYILRLEGKNGVMDSKKIILSD